MTIKWGDPIECNGVRPDWLRDGEEIQFENTAADWLNGPAGLYIWDARDECPISICLPADHPAYVALARGFTPWSGGESAPVDWDGGECLARSGRLIQPVFWTHPWNATGCGVVRDEEASQSDVIGYRKRVEYGAVHTDGIRSGGQPPRNLTEAEVRAIVGGFDAANRMVEALATRGLIRPESRAERFTRETGHEVTEAVEAALNWKGE